MNFNTMFGGDVEQFSHCGRGVFRGDKRRMNNDPTYVCISHKVSDRAEVVEVRMAHENGVD